MTPSTCFMEREVLFCVTGFMYLSIMEDTLVYVKVIVTES